MKRPALHLLFILLAALGGALDAETTVETRFNPARLSLGNPAQYIVEIVETNDQTMPEAERISSLPIPDPGALELRNGRTSTSAETRILNGRPEYSRTQSLIIDAIPPRTGSFTIPAYEFTYKGETLRAPAATLEVLERDADAGPATDELVFLEADAPDNLYLGQSVPLHLKLYLNERVRLGDLESFNRTADGFTLSDLPRNPDETIETVDGRRYRVLTWPLALTPIQEGRQDLGFQFSLRALLPDSDRRDPFGRRSPFGGGIFDDFFGRPERINVYTEPHQVEVKPLPEEDRPDSFSGAIGEFTMRVEVDSRNTTEGEPVMLSVEVKGRGNFDRIQGPPLPEDAHWRSYPPESDFEADDDLGLRGTKRFDYVITPQTPGTLRFPPVKFAYFDPVDQTYTELVSRSITVEVAESDTPAPSPAPDREADADAPTEADAPELERTLSPEEALTVPDYRPRPARNLDADPFRAPWFYLLNGLCLLAFLALALTLRHRRRLRSDPDYALLRAARRELNTACADAVQAARAGDADAFFRAAQRAVRLDATTRARRDLRNAELPELEAEYTRLGADDSVNEANRALFAQAHARRFSGRHTDADLAAAQAQLETILNAR